MESRVRRAAPLDANIEDVGVRVLVERAGVPAANAAVVRLMGTDLLTVRIDLYPERRD